MLFKRIILVVFISAFCINFFSACSSKPESVDSPANDASTKTENIFSDDELKEYIASKNLEGKHKYYERITGEKSGVMGETKDNFYISEITELSYEVQETARDKVTITVSVIGSFKATGGTSSDAEATKTTAEPVSFSLTAKLYSNGISFDAYRIKSPPLIVPIDPVDLDNIAQYIDYSIPYIAPNPDFTDESPSHLWFVESEIDFSNPNMRIVITGDPFPDNDCFIIETYCDIYDGDTFLTEGKLNIIQNSSSPIHVTAISYTR